MPSFICLGEAPIAGCGRILTDEERYYYSTSCEDCARLWGEEIDAWRAGGPNVELDRMFSALPPVMNG
jgi:hypothetical protein